MNGDDSTHQPRHAPSNADDATMDFTSDEQPLTHRSRRLSKRQMEKAPEGMAEDYQEQQQESHRHSPDHVDRGRLPSPRQQQQHVGDHTLPPPVPYGGPPSPTTSPPGPRFVTNDTKVNSGSHENGVLGHGNVRKGSIIPSHVGGRHVSPPPPLDTENDGEEVTGDGDDNRDEEDDIYTDDGNRDVSDHVRSTESAAPGTEAGTVPAVGTGVHPYAVDEVGPRRLDGDEPEGYEHGATDMSHEAQQKEPTVGVSVDVNGMKTNASISGGTLISVVASSNNVVPGGLTEEGYAA